MGKGTQHFLKNLGYDMLGIHVLITYKIFIYIYNILLSIYFSHIVKHISI